jgi:hypothetical protein
MTVGRRHHGARTRVEHQSTIARMLAPAGLVLLFASAAALGCRSNVGDMPGGPKNSSSSGASSTGGGASTGNGGGTSTGGMATGGAATGGTPSGPFVPAPAGLRRLTVPQYLNTIKDLFFEGGVASTLDPEVAAVLPLNGFASIGAALLSVSSTATEQFETAALDVAKQAMSDVAHRATLVGCMPAGITDDACTGTFLKTFGRRAWRRPLTSEELGIYLGLVNGLQKSTGDFYQGLQYGIAALLQSPNFLYRVELGTPDPTKPSQSVFNDFELATRLSFFLWNTTPDDVLLDAAQSQQLTKGSGLATQAQRLLGSPRLVDAIRTFFTEYYRLADLDKLPQDPTLFPQRTATIGASMREETLRFLTDIAFTRNVDYRSLFDSRTTYVNAELAKLYGVAGPATGFAAVTLPDSGMRTGYLGQGSFLALNAHNDVTSPTYRGKFVQEMLLCQTIPPPPPGVPPLPPNSATAQQTMRQKLEMHRAVEPCKTCHSMMDPIGLAFENFDAIGAFRTIDAMQAIDASGTLNIGGQMVSFSGPRQLATLLTTHPQAGPCVVKNVYRYAMGHVENDGELAAVTTLSTQFESGGFKLLSLIGGVVQHPAFAYAAPAP